MFTLWKVSKAQKTITEMVPSLDDFIRENSETGETEIDGRLVKVFDVIGSRMAQSMRMAFLQGLSADSKIEKGAEAAIATDLIDANLPILGLVDEGMERFLGGGFHIKEYLVKNPRALPYILKLAKNAGLGDGLLKGNSGGGSGRGQM